MKAPDNYRGREQTYVKHLFLEKYLERVAWNIFSFRDEFVYVDGFSGPWKSEDKDYKDTSFIIALEKLRNVRDGLKAVGKRVTVRCLFNDNDQVAFEEMKKAVETVSDIEVITFCEDFENIVPEIVSYVGNSFSLVFIDPKGWTGFGLPKIRPILQLRGEVLINFMFDPLNRFLEDPRPEIAASYNPLFGGPSWYQEVEERVNAGEGREDAVLAVYREGVRRFGDFRHVTSTRILKPLVDRSYYHLVYGTRNLKGLVEFRAVEKKTVESQENVRNAAKYSDRAVRTGMDDLFGSVGYVDSPRSYSDERAMQLSAGESRLSELLELKRHNNFDDILGELLERPLVWTSDVNGWLKKLQASGEITFLGLKPRERIPKRGHGHMIVRSG